MFSNKSILTLDDDNEYAVVDTFTKNDVSYVYLVDINNNSNMFYGKVVDDEIVQITDPTELESIIKIVYADLHKKN